MSQEQSHPNKYRFKLTFVSVVFVAFYLAILFRSYHLQILGNSQLNSLAKSQYRTELVERPKRGAIYDRNGEVLAMDVMVASVGVHPHLVRQNDPGFTLRHAPLS